MKFIRLTLNNFRSFYGEHKIEFSSDDQQPVTIFVGDNGHGKTTLLNAIHWALCGKTTPRLDNSSQLINLDAFSEGVRTTSVTLELVTGVTGSPTYRIERTGGNSGQSDLMLFETRDGITQRSRAPDVQGAIYEFLPKGLIGWFIFDGEAINEMKLDGSPNLRRDVRKTFGLNTVDTLLNDLEHIERSLQREISRQDVGSVVPEKLENLERLEKSRDLDTKERDELGAELLNLKTNVDLWSGELRKFPDTARLELERTRVVKELDVAKGKFKRVISERARRLGDGSLSLLAFEGSQKLIEVFDKLEKTQKLPSNVGESLIHDILKDGRCICGRAVEPGSGEHESIHGLLDTAATSLLSSRIMHLRYKLFDIKRVASQFENDYLDKTNQISELGFHIGGLELRKKQIRTEMEGIPVRVIAELNNQLNDADERITIINRKIGALDDRINVTKSQIARLKSEINSIQLSASVAQSLILRRQRVSLVRDYIARKLVEQERVTFDVLAQEINSCLQKYLTRDYTVSIDPQTYKMEMLRGDGTRIPTGAGDGLVLRYAFIAAIVGMAAKNTATQIDWLARPVVAPVCMDAPFSALDESNSGNVASTICDLCDQVILLFKGDAWPTLEQKILKKIGRVYLLISEAKGVRGDRPVKDILIMGTRHALNDYGAERDQTVVKEVYRA